MSIEQLANPSAQGVGPRSVAEALGQVTWVLTQSPLHREMKLKDLEWAILPAVAYEQFRLFRLGPLPDLDASEVAKVAPPGLSPAALEQLPLGVAIWARLSEVAEGKLERGERLSPEEWRSGDRIWLVELISPFATPDNKLLEVMLLDLIRGPFEGVVFNLHRTDPSTGRRERVVMDAHVTLSAVG